MINYWLVGGAILLVIILLASWQNQVNHEELRAHCDRAIGEAINSKQTETIFVCVSNYRDPDLPWTLLSLFGAAKLPHRIFVGVCHQTTENNLDLHHELHELLRTPEHRSLLSFTSDPNIFLSTHVRFEFVPHVKSRGAAHGRAAALKRLYCGEKYVVTVDSCMRFAHDWDDKALNALHNCASDKPIITEVPGTFDAREGILVMSSGRHVPSNFVTLPAADPQHRHLITSSRPFAGFPARPVPQLLWCPYFSITFAVAYEEVPPDPNMRSLPMEIDVHLTSARFWTHGWDFYAPLSGLCARRDDASARPDPSELGKSPDDAVARAQGILEFRPWSSIRHDLKPQQNEPCGLGNARTIQEFHNHCSYDSARVEVHRNGRSGISANPHNDEILSKYGGFSELRYALMCSGGGSA